MSNHLVIHLSDDQVTCILINDDNEILKTCKSSYQELKSCLHSLTKEQKNDINRIVVIPETSTITTTFLRVTIGATDNFNESLVNKLHNDYIPTKDTVIKYKIISESQADKIEYLLSVLIIPIKFYQSINKSISKIKQKNSIQWIPANYCLTLSIIDCVEFSDTPLIIHITDTQTNIIIKEGTEAKAISTLPFSVEKLKLCLQKDGFSDNQINNKLSIRLSFEKELGFNTRLLINDTLSDLQKEIQFVCSINKISINSCYIITDQLKHSDLAKIIAEKLIIPCQYVTIPETTLNSNMINNIQEKRLLTLTNKALQIVKDMQIFLTYVPKKTISELTNTKHFNFKKETIIFFASLFAIFTIIIYINLEMSRKSEMAKSTLYGIKDQVNNTKSQYIDVAESLYIYKKQQILYDHIINLEKENIIIKTSLETIFQSLPNNINLSDISINLRNKRILITGQTQKGETVSAYIKTLNSLLNNQKVLLKRSSPTSPIRFAIEVQL